MKLSKIAILALRGSKDLRDKLAAELKTSLGTVNRWVANNDDSLTKAAALKVIREELNLTDVDLLEEESKELTPVK